MTIDWKELVDVDINSGSPYDRLSKQSKFLTALAWEYCSAEAIIVFLEGIRAEVEKENHLIRELEYKTPFFLVLAPGEENPYSRYRHSSIDCDASEWYVDLSPESRGEIDNLDQDRLIDIKEKFEETIQLNLRNFLKKNRGCKIEGI